MSVWLLYQNKKMIFNYIHRQLMNMENLILYFKIMIYQQKQIKKLVFYVMMLLW